MKQMVNIGRRLHAADMKKLEGGIRVGTGSFRCGLPPTPCATTYVPGNCCDCCAGPAGALCRKIAQKDPACYLV